MRSVESVIFFLIPFLGFKIEYGPQTERIELLLSQNFPTRIVIIPTLRVEKFLFMKETTHILSYI